MVLVATRKLRQIGQAWMAVASLAFIAGCVGGPEEARNSAKMNKRLDTLDKAKEQLARADSPAAVRSQSPLNTSPTIAPVTNISMDDPAGATPPPLPPQSDAQVRIVAVIGTIPIYAREVDEAIAQRLPEIINLSTADREAKRKEMFKEELRRLIERELILDELFAVLTQKKQSAALKQLQDSAAKESEQRLREIQKRTKLTNEEDLKLAFQGQGLTIAGMKRNIERNFMMSAYLGERMRPKVSGISLVDVRDYYEEHPEEFKTDDRVKWQDLFIRVDRFRSKEDAKKYTDWLVNRAVQGEDFIKLVNEFDQGDSKARGGLGFGEEKGKIFPQELETTVFSMKQGQVTVVDFETGYHIVRIAERNYAGKKPFDERVQNEIKRKLQAIVNEREYRNVVDTLWRRSQPQILVD